MLSAGKALRQIFNGSGVVDNICNFIIRPPRSDYEIDDLGPMVFRVGDEGQQRYDRTDFELENMRGVMLQCSWFRPLAEHSDGRRQRRPCVVYCHANCGSRYDSLEALFLLENGFSLFAFDSSGSGMSEGEYISLGFYERQDLAVVVEFLHSKVREVDGVGLWGRSMGAVTAIMYAAKDPDIRCIVCDSPFASLRILIQSLVTQHGGKAGQLIPSSIVTAIVNGIRSRITSRAAFDIDDLDTLKYAAMCAVPALIIHGAQDDFVAVQQSLRVQSAFLGPCLHEVTAGGHNDERDENTQNFIAAFFRLYMVEKPMGQREQREQRLGQQQRQQQRQQRPQEEGKGAAASTGASSLSVARTGPASTSLRGQPEEANPQRGDEPAGVYTGTVKALPSTPSPAGGGRGKPPQSATPTANGAGGGVSRGTVVPIFSQTEERRPRMMPAGEGTDDGVAAGAARGLGPGQSGPANAVPPCTTAAETEAGAAASPTAVVDMEEEEVPPPPSTPFPAYREDEEETVIVDYRRASATSRT